MVLVYGTSCLQFAVVDSLTIKVHFPPHVVSVSKGHVRTDDDSSLNAPRSAFRSHVRAGAYSDAVPRPLGTLIRYAKKYDDASWHYGGDFPEDLPNEAGATHTGMLMAWALLSGLGGAIHVVDSPDDIPSLKTRSVTPGAFFLSACDGRFTDEDLNAEGNAFVESYFDFKRGQYLRDYQATLGDRLLSLYHVVDSWENYDKLSPILDSRLNEWRRASKQ